MNWAFLCLLTLQPIIATSSCTESIFNQEVQAAEIQCEQDERYLEEQIAEYESWQMDNMTERSCCGLNIKDEECSVLCPICRKGNLFLNDNEIITCRESFCACRITHGSLTTLRQCLDNLYSQHIVTCPYGSLIFDIQRHGQSDVLCAHCHQCHLDTIILWYARKKSLGDALYL